MSSKLAEWARDPYLGPVVAFGEWATYIPPKVGGKSAFSLAVASSKAVEPSSTSAKSLDKPKASVFRAAVTATLASLAGKPLPGEGPAGEEDMITRDGPMLACEVAWLCLFCAGSRA